MAEVNTGLLGSWLGTPHTGSYWWGNQEAGGNTEYYELALVYEYLK